MKSMDSTTTFLLQVVAVKSLTLDLTVATRPPAPFLRRQVLVVAQSLARPLP